MRYQSAGLSRQAQVAVLVAVLVVMVLALLYAVRADRPAGPTPPAALSATPTATASPTAALATATPSATATPVAAVSPSPTAATSDRYGFISTTQGDIVVRRERGMTPVFQLTGVSPAVSPDGRRIAYWRTQPNVGANDLRILDVADPNTDRSAFVLTGQTLGGAVVWSSDGQGLLLETHSRENLPGIGGGPAQSDLVMLDLASTPPATRSAATQLSGGRVYVPVAWDRPGQAAAAIVTGEGGYATEYATWNGKAASPFARAEIARPLLLASTVVASPDAKLVLGVEDSLNVLRVWPVLDVGKADQVRHPSRISLFPVWRPVAIGYEVVWAVGAKVDLFRYRTDQSTTLYTSTGNVGIAAVRADGSAVLVWESVGGPPPPPTKFLVIDIAARQSAEAAAIAGGLHVVPRGVLLR